MPAASPQYCRNTPISKMGFTQRSSCKAQGIIPRTSKSLKGKRVKSPKYLSKKTPKRSPKRSPKIRSYRMNSTNDINTSLYSSGKGKPRVPTGYANEEKAKMTLKNIKPFDKVYQTQVVTTMYNRAKHHPNQTPEMRKAMKIYKAWLDKR